MCRLMSRIVLETQENADKYSGLRLYLSKMANLIV